MEQKKAWRLAAYCCFFTVLFTSVVTTGLVLHFTDKPPAQEVSLDSLNGTTKGLSDKIPMDTANASAMPSLSPSNAPSISPTIGQSLTPTKALSLAPPLVPSTAPSIQLNVMHDYVEPPSHVIENNTNLRGRLLKDECNKEIPCNPFSKTLFVLVFGGCMFIFLSIPVYVCCWPLCPRVGHHDDTQEDDDDKTVTTDVENGLDY